MITIQVQQDYSDAINLLQTKVNELQKELQICKEKKNEILEENKKMNSKCKEKETRKLYLPIILIRNYYIF